VSYFTIKNHTFASLLASDRLAAMSLIPDSRALSLTVKYVPLAVVDEADLWQQNRIYYASRDNNI